MFKFKLYAFIVCLIFMNVFCNLHAKQVTFEYDEMDRLVQVNYNEDIIIVYTYDANGNRLSKKVTVSDSDEDGLNDLLESTSCTNATDADSDEDGILDGDEDSNHNGRLDQGETNPCDIDTDNDGIQDGTEISLTLNDVGSDTDTDVFQPDVDPKTSTEPLDNDTDDDREDGRDEPRVYKETTGASEVNSL